MSTVMEPVVEQASNPDALFFELVDCKDENRRKEIIDILYLHHKNLAYFIVNKRITDKICEKYRMTMDEFYSIACEKLYRCIPLYDPTRKVMFSTYAGRSVTLILLNVFRDFKHVGETDTLNKSDSSSDASSQSEEKICLIKDSFDLLEQTVNRKTIQEFFDHLSTIENPRNVKAYYLHTVKSMTINQIAAELGMTRSNVGRLMLKIKIIAQKYAEEHNVFGR
jgi:RNA polymerase sigma factor (sigma-70 family)